MNKTKTNLKARFLFILVLSILFVNPMVRAGPRAKAKPARAKPKAKVEPVRTVPKVENGSKEVNLEKPPIRIRITRNSPLKDQIQGLSLEMDELSGIASSENSIPYVSTISGNYLGKKDWTLLIETQLLEITDKKTGKFANEVKIKKPVTDLNVFLISPTGEVQKETVRLEVLDWPGSKQKDTPVKRKRFLATLGFGFTYSSYQETGLTPFSQMSLTLKGSFSASPFTHPILSKVDAGVLFYLTAIPLATSVPGSEARFFGANLRFGYRIVDKEPWTFAVYTGLYYTTMFVSNNLFGFADMMGPQLFPAVVRRIGQGTLGAYFKFSPVSSNFDFEPFDNREIAGGLFYRNTLKKDLKYGITLDISNISLSIDGIKVNSSSFSLGFETSLPFD